MEITDELIEKLADEVHKTWMNEELERGFHAPISHGGNVSVDHTLTTEAQVKKALNWLKFTKRCDECNIDLYPYAELPEHIKDEKREIVRAVISALVEIGGMMEKFVYCLEQGVAQLWTLDPKTTAGIYIPCVNQEALKEFVSLLYDNEILTDEAVFYHNVPDDFKDKLNEEKT